MKDFLWVGVGGALGSMARYWVGRALADVGRAGLPWGVMAANVSGAFLLGLIVGAVGERLDPAVRTGLTVGVLGGYTTFSTWALDSVELMRSGAIAHAGLNIVVSLVVGLAAAAAGLWAGMAVAPATA